ncbi:MAG: replication-associated recombination protein A [Haliscomenobacter sp.]|nr:replication-associated recombination protein A [Haliscomenobacter sp.]MBK7476344.1 replication-associated recombination protein A [Haliscomenobacter sp.]MBK8879212.1 replication-associated recombination protein A [Haliscomenobacter sp.]
MRPLAERMRPQSLEKFCGQEHLVGPGSVLLSAVRSGHFPSVILWGPPGVGKTTLAHILAAELKRPFFMLSAINSGVKEVRETIQKAEQQRFFNRPNPILFIDEIHRFSKSQQDSLLGAVEKGVITLIGATTENPSFEVIPALLSRCQVYVLQPLAPEHLIRLVDQALAEDEELKTKTIALESYDALLYYSGGDARKLYNLLELVASGAESPLVVTDQMVKDKAQQSMAFYDKGGEQHYDLASAFIKSIRGSDPNGALYWMARMIEGGEDVKFIARRMIIAAAEDIGLANPNALLMANTAFQAVNIIGWPEARIILAQAVVYLATSPKSNSAYVAIEAALEAARKTGNAPVPLHLRNAPTPLMKALNYGGNYRYGHDFPGNFTEQEYMPEVLSGNAFYQPQSNAAEEKTRQQLRQWWKERYGY